MRYQLEEEIRNDPLEMRSVFCRTLVDMASENPDIVVLDADLMGAMGTKPFAEAFPEQTVDCGIQEANMIGVAAGLSAVGKIPFAHTFAPFCTRRACDQIFVSGAYAHLNVKIVGSDPGITAALNGGTHMPFEDMGIMRGIPTMTVLEPVDTVMLEDLMRQVAGIYGMHYMRLVRKTTKRIYREGSTFDIGKAVLLKDGTDVTIIASGFCVAEALQAAAVLETQGISARVLNIFTWKPIDTEAITRAAAETGAIVTAENHNVINGLGSAVAETLCKGRPVPMEMVGVQDEFGEVGQVDYLADRFGLTEKYITAAVQKVLARKA
ncbi:MAG: transketolase family protein [Agathobaculum sp.]|jgi:transketolase|uniref:transketolase family protein n=1 Tax=Agathobaculum sp. TaxID=2048138 RepID=UPI003D9284DF